MEHLGVPTTVGEFFFLTDNPWSPFFSCCRRSTLVQWQLWVGSCRWERGSETTGSNGERPTRMPVGSHRAISVMGVHPTSEILCSPLLKMTFASLAEFERSIIRERTRAGLDAARARGRIGGRPRSLSAEDLKQARALLTDPEITVEEVTKRLGVGVSTLYRQLPGGRGGVVAGNG